MLDLRKLKNQDIVLIILVTLLSIIGLLTVFSTTFYSDLGASSDFKQQLIFFLIAILAYLVMVTLDSSFLNQPKVQIVLVILTSVILIALLLFGERISGTKRWFVIAGFSFQPSELAKLVVILSTSATFASIRRITVTKPFDVYHQIQTRDWRQLLQDPYLRRFAANIAGVLLIVLLIRAQPSLGNALITLGLWIALLTTLIRHPAVMYAYMIVFGLGLNLLLGIVNLSAVYERLGFSFMVQRVDLIILTLSIVVCLLLLRWVSLRPVAVVTVLVLAAVLAVSADFVWNQALSPYQQDRIVSFLNPDADPLGAQWQVSQAKIAIGSGQVFGRGFLGGTQSNLGLLPFAYTDFAYAAYTEQFGLVGSVVLLTLFYLLVLRIFHIAGQCTDNFGRMVCIGVGLMISLNVIVNVGMNLGIMPVTGVPLPFISYGGSAILVNFLGVGLVQMIYCEYGGEHIKSEKLLDLV